MIPAAACPRIITLEVTETLYAALEVTAEMSQMTVGAVVATALREKAIGKPRSRPIPAPQPVRRAGGEPCLGSLQQAILGHVDASAGQVCDLREVRASLHHYHRTAVSRAVHQLVRLGILEPMMPIGAGFEPDDGRLGQLRFVRRAGS